MEGNSEAVKNGRREQSQLRRKRIRVTLVGRKHRERRRGVEELQRI